MPSPAASPAASPEKPTAAHAARKNSSAAVRGSYALPKDVCIVRELNKKYSDGTSASAIPLSVFPPTRNLNSVSNTPLSSVHPGIAWSSADATETTPEARAHAESDRSEQEKLQAQEVLHSFQQETARRLAARGPAGLEALRSASRQKPKRASPAKPQPKPQPKPGAKPAIFVHTTGQTTGKSLLLRSSEDVERERKDVRAHTQQRRKLMDAERRRAHNKQQSKCDAAQQARRRSKAEAGQRRLRDATAAEEQAQAEAARREQRELEEETGRAAREAHAAQLKKEAERLKSCRFQAAMRLTLTEKCAGVQLPPLCPCGGSGVPSSPDTAWLCWGVNGWVTPATNCPFRDNMALHDRLLRQIVTQWTA